MAELKLGPPYVEDSQIRAVPRISRTFTNQEKRVFCNFEDRVNGFDRRTEDYLQIVLRGYLSCGIRYAGQQFGYTIKVGAYLLSLLSRTSRTVAARSQITIRFLKLTQPTTL